MRTIMRNSHSVTVVCSNRYNNGLPLCSCPFSFYLQFFVLFYLYNFLPELMSHWNVPNIDNLLLKFDGYNRCVYSPLPVWSSIDSSEQIHISLSGYLCEDKHSMNTGNSWVLGLKRWQMAQDLWWIHLIKGYYLSDGSECNINHTWKTAKGCKFGFALRDMNKSELSSDQTWEHSHLECWPSS